MTKKEYEKIDWEVEQAQIRLDIAIYLLKELGSSFEDKKIADTLDDLSDSIRWQRNDLSKEQEPFTNKSALTGGKRKPQTLQAKNKLTKSYQKN